MKSASWFKFFCLILAIAFYVPVWHSHCTKASFTVPVWSSDELAVHSCPLLRLQTHVAKLASALFCCCSLLHNNYMASNLQRFTARSIVNTFLSMYLLTSDMFGRWCSTTVPADNGKTRCFIMCEKKQGWICSNASASKSLKNPLKCDHYAWVNSLIKLRLCRLLFVQCNTTWLVRNTFMKGLWEYVSMVDA